MIINSKRSVPGSTRVDPTRTANLRSQFERNLLARIEAFKKALYELIVKDDAFYITSNAERFTFTSTADQAEAFRKWLSKQLKDKVLGNPKTPSEAWWNEYVKQAYVKGQKRAFSDLKSKKPKTHKEDGTVSDYHLGQENQFLQQSFSNPKTIESLKQLSGRVFTELEGVSNHLSQQITRTLLDGLTQGQSPKEIFKAMSDISDKIGRNRTMMIAQTEIVRIHNEAALDAMEEMGLDQIGVMVEWATAGKPCKVCAPLRGIVIPIKKARGMFPRHPRCKCCPIPANVGEKDTNQKDTKPEIKRAIYESLMAERRTKSSLAKAKSRSTWAGADYK